MARSAAAFPTSIVAAAVAAVLGAFLLASCGPRVEYRPRPGFASEEELPNEVVLDDGTVIRYVPVTEYIARKKARKEGRDYDPEARSRGAASLGGPPPPQFLSWEELQDGAVRMQAIMPEQVVANTMRAFREERFGELWDQLVAEGLKRRAAEEGGPDAARERFVGWATARRTEVMTLLNRMSFGFSTNAVIIRKSGPTSLTLELAPQVAGEFKYRVVEVEFGQTKDGERVFLLGIR
ncbi:MAG: hypothetical protein ACKO0W_03505 [Planctomycetota bacterium]